MEAPFKAGFLFSTDFQQNARALFDDRTNLDPTKVLIDGFEVAEKLAIAEEMDTDKRTQVNSYVHTTAIP
jgi:hypothetical protein